MEGYLSYSDTITITDDQFRERFYSGIIAGFQGACGRLLSTEADSRLAVVWLFADHVLLTYQEPAYVVIGYRDRPDVPYLPVFSSVSVPDRRYLGLRPLEQELIPGNLVGTSAGMHKENERRTLIVVVRRLPPRLGTPVGHDRVLAEGAVEQLLKIAERDLTEALRRTSTAGGDYDVWQAPPAAPPRLPDDGDNLLKPLRRRIAKVLDTIGRCYLTEGSREQKLNLFAVIRQGGASRKVSAPPGRADQERLESNYEYTASLFLGEAHVKSLSAEKPSAEEIQRPLKLSERSIADTSLSQGSIDFSIIDEQSGVVEWSRQKYESDTSSARQRGEEVLYTLERAGMEMKVKMNVPRSIFYAPVHVGGLPWLAVFTFNALSEQQSTYTIQLQDRWRNYLFYRDVLPGLAEALARAVQEAYADVLAESVTREFEAHDDNERFISALNEEWMVLPRYYPYPRVTIAREGEEPQRISLDGATLSTKLYLSWECPARRLPYRLLNESEVRETVASALQRSVARREEAYRRALYVFGHQAGKLFQRSGLPGLDLGRYPELAGMKHRLYAAWGMSSAVRPLKFDGRGLPRDWFEAATMDTSNEETVLHALGQICEFYIASIGVTLPVNWRVAVETGSSSRLVSLGDIRTLRERSLPALPPLRAERGRSEGTLALTMGLAELLQNAEEHLVLYQRQFVRATKDLGALEVRSNAVGAGAPEGVPLVLACRCSFDPSDGAYRVMVENLYMKNPERDYFPSKTIEMINSFERAALSWQRSPIVETAECDVVPIRDDLAIRRASWTYYYANCKAIEEQVS